MADFILVGIFAMAVLAVLKIVYEKNSSRDLKDKEIIDWERSGEYLNIFGFKIFCRIQGEFKSAEKTLCLLHGYPESSFIYKDCISHFEKYFDCIVTLDYVGFGLSEKP